MSEEIRRLEAAIDLEETVRRCATSDMTRQYAAERISAYKAAISLMRFKSVRAIARREENGPYDYSKDELAMMEADYTRDV